MTFYFSAGSSLDDEGEEEEGENVPCEHLNRKSSKIGKSASQPSESETLISKDVQPSSKPTLPTSEALGQRTESFLPFSATSSSPIISPIFVESITSPSITPSSSQTLSPQIPITSFLPTSSAFMAIGRVSKLAIPQFISSSKWIEESYGIKCSEPGSYSLIILPTEIPQV